jgi:hypothetical protein
MAHKAEGTCPVGVAVFVQKEARRLGIPVNQAIIKYSRELEVPVETIRKWVWPSKKAKRTIRPFWEKIGLQLGNIAKALDMHKGEHPLDEPDRKGLLTQLNAIRQLIERQGTTHTDKKEEHHAGKQLETTPERDTPRVLRPCA